MIRRRWILEFAAWIVGTLAGALALAALLRVLGVQG